MRIQIHREALKHITADRILLLKSLPALHECRKRRSHVFNVCTCILYRIEGLYLEVNVTLDDKDGWADGWMDEWKHQEETHTDTERAY